MVIFYITSYYPRHNIQYWYDKPYKRWNTQDAVDKQTNYGGYKGNIAESKEDEKQTIKINPFKFQIEKLTTKGLIQEEYKKPLLSTVFITDTGTVKIKKYKLLKIAAVGTILIIAGLIIKMKMKK